MRVPLSLKSALNDASSQETDQAVIDVEAQEGGVHAKILLYSMWHSCDGAHISELTHPRHRPRMARRMLLSVALSQKVTTFLVLRSWPPIAAKEAGDEKTLRARKAPESSREPSPAPSTASKPELK